MDLYSALVGISIVAAVVAAAAAIMSRLSDNSVIRLKSGQWTIGAATAALAAVVAAVVLRYYTQHPPETAQAMAFGEFLSGHPGLIGVAVLAGLSLLLGNTATK
jgi:hypothetical protein